MGIDTDTIENLVKNPEKTGFTKHVVSYVFGLVGKSKNKLSISNGKDLDRIFKEYRVILGIDRLDYTKGLRLRLMAIDRFFERHPDYIGQVIYLGILAPSREAIPAYVTLRKDIKELTRQINEKYGTKNWQPIHLSHEVYSRQKVMNLYKRANLCLVTPLDDGMNLVSKEFVVASYFAPDPGMLVLSQFAGSSIDLTQSLIVNPYNIDEVVSAIKRGLEMSKQEKTRRIKVMKETLDDRNMYQWAQSFVRNAVEAVNRKRS
ncbi:MAG: trehalose-6-phosphate synthase [Candidatus Levybacteria bacterium]|nr:trehalose-6-phosphate synthase [Candidatus Levybacteria bacterium]